MMRIAYDTGAPRHRVDVDLPGRVDELAAAVRGYLQGIADERWAREWDCERWVDGLPSREWLLGRPT